MNTTLKRSRPGDPWNSAANRRKITRIPQMEGFITSHPQRALPGRKPWVTPARTGGARVGRSGEAGSQPTDS
jgi:hypothetical protein